MGIALLSAARLVMAVPGWIDRLAPESPWPQSLARGWRARRQHRHLGAPPSCLPGASAAARTAPLGSPLAGARPLRVLRVVDAGQPADRAGRMVISGRIADVCAELDRLAAAEDAAAHTRK